MAQRPYTLSIAGIDPSAGAGLLSDIKTFEQLKVYGLGVPTANTIQTEDKFFANQWLASSYVIEGVSRMIHSYDVRAVKIGIIENDSLLFEVVDIITRKDPDIQIVWDPVMKASSTFNFQTSWVISHSLLKKITVVTPNKEEWDTMKINEDFSETTILLKGGHDPKEKGKDVLMRGDDVIEIPPKLQQDLPAKHGSGCVFSSALTAYLAHGNELETACNYAKEYVEHYLSSSKSLLGYHGEAPIHITG